MVNYTKDYGYIIESEKPCEDKEKDAVVSILREKLRTLNLEQMPKEKLYEIYERYKKTWKSVVSTPDLPPHTD
jgi:hypothetical protein